MALARDKCNEKRLKIEEYKTKENHIVLVFQLKLIDWTEDEFNWLPSWLSNWISHYSTISAISCASMFLSSKKQKWYKRDFGSIHTRGMYWGFLVQFKCIISLTEEWKKKKKKNLPKLILLLTKSREGPKPSPPFSVRFGAISCNIFAFNLEFLSQPSNQIYYQKWQD